MIGIVITSVVTAMGTKILVVFNDLAGAPGVKYKRAQFWRHAMSFQEDMNDAFVRVENAQGENWPVSYNLTPDTLKVDTVDGVAPTDNAHLFDLLYNL